MPSERPGSLYFTDVVRIEKGGVALLGNYFEQDDDEEERTAFLTFRNGRWGALDLAGICHGVRFTGTPEDPERYLIVLDRERGAYRIDGKASVSYTDIGPDREGLFSAIEKIDNNWYAVGGYLQVYRSTPGGWRPIDEGLFAPGRQGESAFLHSIAGTSADDLYVAGFDGLVAHFDGKGWSRLEVPTRVGFEKVLCNGDNVYLCGAANSLYRYSHGEWKDLSDNEEEDVLWDMTVFQDDVYVCSSHQLFIVQEDGLSPVDIECKGKLEFFRMDSDEEELWACGGECLLQFDGDIWKKHEFPDNT